MEDELCKVRNQNAVLQTEIEELSRTLEASSQDDLGAPLAASMAHIARLEAENKQLVAELNESDRLVQRQV